MCQYCRERGKRGQILNDDEIIVMLKKKGILGFTICIELKHPSKYRAISTSIHYCPMCGRKLKEG